MSVSIHDKSNYCLINSLEYWAIKAEKCVHLKRPNERKAARAKVRELKRKLLQRFEEAYRSANL